MIRPIRLISPISPNGKRWLERNTTSSRSWRRDTRQTWAWARGSDSEGQKQLLIVRVADPEAATDPRPSWTRRRPQSTRSSGSKRPRAGAGGTHELRYRASALDHPRRARAHRVVSSWSMGYKLLARRGQIFTSRPTRRENSNTYLLEIMHQRFSAGLSSLAYMCNG